MHWQLSAHPSGHGFGYVHAGSAGQLHVHPSEDGARMALVDRPPMLVWRDLLHLIEDCLAAPS